jgi:hypothetical protein
VPPAAGAGEQRLPPRSLLLAALGIVALLMLWLGD